MIDNIPEENRVKPRMSIIGPAIDILKYNMDETDIKMLFANLLTSEMDDRKQSKVLPAYIEIIKQLSKEDCELIATLASSKRKMVSLISIIDKNILQDSQIILKEYISINTFNENLFKIINPPSIVINNLERLSILKIKYGEFLAMDENHNKKAFEKIKSDDFSNYLQQPNHELSYKNNTLEITDFGKQFIDICCSNNA